MSADMASIMASISDSMKNEHRTSPQNSEPRLVSLGTLAEMVDAHRSTVRRWLIEAGIRPVVMGRGRHGAIRYYWREIKSWLESRKYVD